MQIVKITHSAIMSEAVNFAMLSELAALVGMSVEQLNNAAKGVLAKSSKNVQQLSYGKLRTIITKKLHDSVDFGATFAAGSLEVEFNCLPDIAEPNINDAGKNKSTSSGQRSRATGGKPALKGAYVVVKNGLKCNKEQDPEKYALWQFVWTCNTFEDFFAKAPAKAITKTGRIITASSEIQWAVKSGWIKPVAAE